MPYPDPEARREYARAYAKRYAEQNPGHDRDKHKRLREAEAVLREKYRKEYDEIVRDLIYEGVPRSRRYELAKRELKRRHPKVWKDCRERTH